MTREYLCLRMLKALLPLLLAIPLAGCQDESQNGVASVHAASQSQTSQHETGRKIYNFRCYYCHGYSGNAKTLATTYLSPKPVDFTLANTQTLTPQRIIESIRDGRAGTAMAGFRGILTPQEIESVAHFVRDEFMIRKAINTRYHIAENGWPSHERYRDAYPFATGELGVDTPWEQLTAQQAAGKRLYLAACVTCHDRGRESADGIAWELRAVSYPRNEDSCLTCHDSNGKIKPSAEQVTSAQPRDAGSGPHAQHPADASGPYARHDIAPQIAGLTAQQRLGEQIYQKNCAFCHAADGTGRNWIGAFLEPHPRDFTDARAMAGMNAEKLLAAIRNGVPGGSMPAWKFVLKEHEIEAVASYISRAFYPGLKVGLGNSR